MKIGFWRLGIGGGAVVGKETSIGSGDADDAVSIRAIQAALDAGINFLTLASIFSGLLGHSEEILAKAVRHDRRSSQPRWAMWREE